MQSSYYVTAMALFINGSFPTFNYETLRHRYFVSEKYIVTNMFDNYRYLQCLQYDEIDDDCGAIDDDDDDMMMIIIIIIVVVVLVMMMMMMIVVIIIVVVISIIALLGFS